MSIRVEELGLACGDVMQLQVGDDTTRRYPVRFYGINPNGSVIVSAPRTREDRIILLREAQLVTLRFVVKNVASGFTTRVLATHNKPYSYVHLEIPSEIQTVEVRKEVRVDTDIAVTVMNKTHNSPALAARLVNLSCSGGRIESEIKMALEGNILDVTAKIDIGGIERLLNFQCEVIVTKTVNEDELFAYGVEITHIDDEDRLLLRAFVYQEILRHLHMI